VVSEAQVDYQGGIDAVATLVACDENGSGRYDCEAQYSNAFSEAVGRPPTHVPMSFTISDDKVVRVNTFFTRNLYPIDFELDSSFANFMVVAGLAEDYHQACFPLLERDSACAAFQMSHLDDWSTWYLSQG
jgi:hypothetical protein